MKPRDAILVRNSGWIDAKRIQDARDGLLCILQAGTEVPFEIKRLYYITNLENAHSVRGLHAHRKLWQAIFCLSGSFTLHLDDGAQQQDLRMWRSDLGVVLGPGLWHSMHDFSNGCVLLVVASDHYDESDYIRSYDEFKQYISGLS